MIMKSDRYFSELQGFIPILFFIPKSGNGQPRSSGAFGPSAEPEVLTDEVEYLRKIFSPRAFTVLYNFFDIRHSVFVPVDGLQQQYI